MKNCFIALLCTLYYSSYAQYRPPGMNDMRLINNISEVLERAMPELENRSAIGDAENAIKNKRNLIEESLKWTANGGYLIRVKVLRNTISGATVPMPPEFLGSGAIPSDIVALSASSPSISTAPNPNLVLANDRTFYVWVTNKSSFLGLGDKKLTYGYIVSPFSEQVTSDALKKMANSDVLNNIKVAKRGEVLYGITVNLKNNVKDKAAALRTTEQMDVYRKNLETLNNLETNLKKDLKKIEQANQSLNFINTMQNILSVASLGIQIKAAMEDIPQSQIDKAKTPNDLIMSVETYKREANGRVEQGQRNIMIIKDDNTQNRTIIINELHRMGVPSNIINSGFLELP